MEQYVLYFPTELGIEEFSIHTTRPEIKLPKITIPYMSSQSHISGASFWHPIKMVINYKITEKYSSYFLKWINLFYYNPKIGRGSFATGYKKNIIINQTDSIGKIIEEWTLIGCYLEERNKEVFSINDTKLMLRCDRAFRDV